MIRTFCPAAMRPGVQALEGGEPRHRDDGGLLEAQPGGLANQFVLSRSGVFGERTPGDAEHLVTDLEPGDIGTDRSDRARHVQPRDVVLRPPKPEAQDPHQIWLPPHQMTCAPVHASRAHVHKDLVGCHNGLLDL